MKRGTSIEGPIPPAFVGVDRGRPGPAGMAGRTAFGWEALFGGRVPRAARLLARRGHGPGEIADPRAAEVPG